MGRLTEYEVIAGHVHAIPNVDTELIVQKLAHYEDMEEAGRLIELPCAVGDTVWLLLESLVGGYEVAESKILTYTKNRITEFWEVWFDCKENDFRLDIVRNDFGESVFLTKEEAEAKLKELEGEHSADVRKMLEGVKE